MTGYKNMSLGKATYRRKVWAIPLVGFLLALLVAFLLHASEPGFVVEGCPEERTTGYQRVEKPLRVLSLNMLHGHPEFEDLQVRLDLIAAGIKRLEAKVFDLHTGQVWLLEERAETYLAAAENLPLGLVRRLG